MAKNNGRNLNVTIKNQDDNKDEVVISFSSIIKQLKRFLTLWLVAAIIAGILAFAFSAIQTFSKKNPAKALVSFSYSGIEKGLDPARTYMAMERACTLLQKYADAEIETGIVKYDVTKNEEKVIEISYKEINDVLGTNISKEDIVDVFRKIKKEV